VTRFLSSGPFTSKARWHRVKPHIRQREAAEGVLMIDDTIEEKPSPDEHEIIGWHDDHSNERHVKGIHVFRAL